MIICFSCSTVIEDDGNPDNAYIICDECNEEDRREGQLMRDGQLVDLGGEG